MLRTLSSSDSELPSVDTGPLALPLSTTINNTWLNTNLTTDLEDWRFSPKETPRERQRNNLKGKSRKLEVQKREKFLLLENQKAEPTSRRPNKLTSRRLSPHDSDVLLNISHTF